MKALGLYQHSGSKNHGCEALIKSTYELFNNSTSNFFVITGSLSEDQTYFTNQNIKFYDRNNVNKKTLAYLKYMIKYRISNITSSFPICTWQIKEKDYVAMSVGGDNYCYTEYDWLTKDLIGSHKWLINHNHKTVLWGASIEEKTLQNEDLLNDLKKFDLITVRESLSERVLEKYGLKDNVVKTCDSAFLLDKEEVNIPKGFKTNGIIGINCSPLVIEKNELVLDNYKRLIEYILRNTEYNIALIPHVIWDGNDDRDSNKKLYEEFRDSGRIMCVEDCNCEKLKGYISQCRFFVGARTHATIAAYSSFVPTLVVGYSIKSKGIATDLFGTYEKYVIASEKIKSGNELVDSFIWLEEHEEETRNKLESIMPSYTKQIDYAVEKVKEMLNDE